MGVYLPIYLYIYDTDIKQAFVTVALWFHERIYIILFILLVLLIVKLEYLKQNLKTVSIRA